MTKPTTASAAIDSEFKSFASLDVKDDAKGEVEAVVATIGVIDREGDIIRAGAIKSGSKVTMSGYGHDAVYGATPVGRGTLGVEGKQAVFRGRLFLSTLRGRETFDVLKEMGAHQEWSFGFRVTGWEEPSAEEKKGGAWRVITKLDAFEVSPVLVGAGIDTQTLGMKAAAPGVAQADGAGETPVAEVPAVVVETPAEAKADPLIDVRARRQAAADALAELKTQEANLVASEIFARFKRNMTRASA